MPAPTQSFWNSLSDLTVVSALLGILMGLVYVLMSWKGSLKGSDPKSDPRVRGVVYLVAGFFATLWGNWEKLLGLKDLDRARPLCFYLAFLIVTIVAGVGFTGLSIHWRFSAQRRSHSSDYPAEPFSPVLDYFHYGYQYYMQQYTEALERKRNDQLRRYRELNAMAASQLAGDILTVSQYRMDPSEAFQSTVCKRILEHICLIVQAHMEVGSKPNLNANIMVAIPTSQLSDPAWTSVKFTYQDRKKYGHILLLKHYAYPQGEEQFALPVEDPLQVQDWKDWVLLGAPDAFLSKKELVIRTQELDFAKHVPQNIRREIKEYFVRKDFRSFACLIVPKDGRPHGIVNVESNHDHIFQESEDMQNDMAKLLKPFCVLLGLVA